MNQNNDSHVEICAVGGYGEVGKNMTAVRVDDEVVIFDMGINLDNYISYTNDEEIIDFKPNELINAGAIPDIFKIKDWKNNVKAIVITHGHLDHVGGVEFLDSFFDAPIICTPYTAAVLKQIIKNEKKEMKNPVRRMNQSQKYKLSKKLTLEFVNATHSIPQAIFAVLHTPYGSIVYANDYKFDDYPVIGKKPDYKRLKQLGKNNVLALIVESLYARELKKTPSESVAKEMLKEVLLGVESDGRLIIVTTFSSHIARLTSIIECGKRLKRRIVFLGRSLDKYVKAGEEIGLINFKKTVEIVKFRGAIEKKLRRIMRDGKQKYLIVCTGHQGEPKSVLSRISTGEIQSPIGEGDLIVFSCTVIPSDVNRANRDVLERNLKQMKVRMFKDIHVSGHAAKEDHRDLVNMLKPKHIIPSHGSREMALGFLELATEMGYKVGETVHILSNGRRLVLR